MIQKQPIILLINYSRSGGTLLSRCLLSLPNIILLSEVHPLGQGFYTISQQVKKWYNIEIETGDYSEELFQLYNYCIKNNKKLIIRDWTFFDYHSYEGNDFSPSFKLTNLEFLRDQYNVTSFAFVRNAIDVWISSNMPDDFFENYLLYIETLINKNIVHYKYENFINDPKKVMKLICEQIGVKFSDNFLTSYLTEYRTTGDNFIYPFSRGIKQRSIKPLKRKRIPKRNIKVIEKDEFLQKANEILGYSFDYYNAEIEKKPKKILIELKSIYESFIKKGS